MKIESFNKSLRTLFLRFLLVGLALCVYSGNLLAASTKLAWDASTSSGVGGYKLSYGTSSGNYTSTIDAGNTTTYTVSGLTEGAKYYFAVKAYDTAKTTESAYSNEINTTIPVITQVLTADFTASATSGAPGMLVTFTPDVNGTVTDWKWDLPGSDASNSTSTAQFPTVTYSIAGTYSVSLTATGPNGAVTTTKSNLITVTTPLAVAPAPTPEPTPTPTPEPSVSNGLVAAYGFDEIDGASVNDASGNGNHGTINEAVRIQTGKYGKALQFDGINDWVTVNDSAALGLSTGMTLEAWVYPQSQVSWNTIILKESSGGLSYALYSSDVANLPASYFNNGSSDRPVSGPNGLPVNQWTHLVASYDGQYQRLYVNGIEVAQSAQNGLIQQSDGLLRIGGNSVWGEYFKGYIDEVRIYNRALTATEVNANLTTAINAVDPVVSAPEPVVNAPEPLPFILGNTNLEPWVDYQPKGRAQAFQAVAEKSGSVTEVKVYLDASTTTTTQLVAGIYTNNNGHPGTLVAQGSLSTLNPGDWNVVTIPKAAVSAGQAYWFAILGANGQIGFLDQVGSGKGLMEISYSSKLASLPSKWRSSTKGYKTSAAMSIYGVGN